MFLTTSANLLYRHSQQRCEQAAAAEQAVEQQRLLLMTDLCIKAQSYACLNKLCFWLALASAIAVVLWPILPRCWPWLDSIGSGGQTLITALSALTFGLYRHYKNRQTHAETLMRHLLFSDEPISAIALKIIHELQQIDGGFQLNPMESPPSQTLNTAPNSREP